MDLGGILNDGEECKCFGGSGGGPPCMRGEDDGVTIVGGASRGEEDGEEVDLLSTGGGDGVDRG